MSVGRLGPMPSWDGRDWLPIHATSFIRNSRGPVPAVSAYVSTTKLFGATRAFSRRPIFTSRLISVFVVVSATSRAFSPRISSTSPFFARTSRLISMSGKNKRASSSDSGAPDPKRVCASSQVIKQLEAEIASSGSVQLLVIVINYGRQHGTALYCTVHISPVHGGFIRAKTGPI